MRYVDVLKRVEEERSLALRRYLSKFRDKRVTVVLFGSRARGDHNLHSDYDLLVISESPVEVKPHLIEPALVASCFNVLADELREKVYESSIVVSALVEGMVLLDSLGLENVLKDLRERIKLEGARVTANLIAFPRSSYKPCMDA